MILNKKILIKINNNNIEVNYNNLIKIDYFYQLLEDRDYNEIKEININKVNYNNLKLILKFTEIENNEIKEYINNIEEVSEFMTSKMPIILVNYLEPFNIKNNKEYDKEIINMIIKFKEDCNYLQYDLLGDIIEYKWADNLRIINKDILKEILIENVNEINNNYNDEINIELKILEEKILRIIFYYYEVDEDEIEIFFKNNIINDEKIYNLIKITNISKLKFIEILKKNIDIMINDLNYII